MAHVRMDRVTWVERVLWIASIVIILVLLALQPSPEEIALGYVNAINNGDLEGALAMTSDDVVLQLILGGYIYGKEQARPALEWRTALDERLRVLSWSYHPDAKEVHTEVEITNDAWDVLGIRPQTKITLVVRGRTLRADVARSDARPLRRSLEPFLAWAAENRQTEFARVWSNRQPIRTAEAARGLLKLLHEWRESRDHSVDGDHVFLDLRQHLLFRDPLEDHASFALNEVH
jgi:hypothetical protein